MANISTRLIVSGQAITSDPLHVDYAKTSGVTLPTVETAGMDIAASGTVTVFSTPATTPTRTFFYIKNTGAVGQNFIEVKFQLPCGEAESPVATDFVIARLERDEFLYLPLAPAITVKASSSAAGTARIEYGYFSAS